MRILRSRFVASVLLCAMLVVTCVGPLAPFAAAEGMHDAASSRSFSQTLSAESGEDAARERSVINRGGSNDSAGEEAATRVLPNGWNVSAPASVPDPDAEPSDPDAASTLDAEGLPLTAKQPGGSASLDDASAGYTIRALSDSPFVETGERIAPAFELVDDAGTVLSVYPDAPGEWIWTGALEGTAVGEYHVTAQNADGKVTVSKVWRIEEDSRPIAYELSLIAPNGEDMNLFDAAQFAYYPKIDPQTYERAPISPSFIVMDTGHNTILSRYPGEQNGWTWSGSLTASEVGTYTVHAANAEGVSVTGSWAIVSRSVRSMLMAFAPLSEEFSAADAPVALNPDDFKTFLRGYQEYLNGELVRPRTRYFGETIPPIYITPAGIWNTDPENPAVTVMNWPTGNTSICPTTPYMTIGKQSGIAEYYVLAGGMKNVYGSDPDHGYAPLNGVEGVDVVIAPKGIVLYIPVNVPFDPQPVTVTYASKEIYYGEFSEQTPAKTDFYQGAATATNPMPEGYAASDWVGVKANAWHKSALNVQDGGLVNAGTYDEVISVGLKQLPEVEDHWYTFTAANTSTGKCNVGGTLTVNPCPIKNDWQDGSKTYDGQPHTEIIHPYQTVGNRIPYTLPYGQSFGGIGSVTVKKNGQAVAGLYEYDALTGKGTVSMTDIGVYTIEISITNPNYTKAPDAVMSITYTIYPKRAEAMIAPQEHIYDPMITYTLPELNTGHAPLVTVLGSDRYLNWEADGTGEFKILSIRRNGVPRNIHEVGDYEVLVQLTNEAASAYVLINPDTNQPWSNGIAVLPYSVRHVIVSVVWDFPNGQAYDYGDRPPLPLVKNQNGDILTLGKEYEIVVTGGDNNTSITINGPAGWNEDSLEALGDYGMEVRLKDPVNYKFGNTEPTHSFTVVAAKIPAPWLNDEFVYSEISGLYETSSISRGGVLTQKDVHWDLSHVRPADLDGWDVDVSVTAVVWPFPFEFTATSPIENVGEYRVEVTLKKSGYVFAFGAGDAREVAGSNGKSAWFIIKINKKVVFPEQIVEGPYNEGELPPEFKEPGDLVNVPDIPKECYEVKVYDKDDENNETERDLAYVNDNPGEYKVVITIICPNYTFPDDEVTVEYEFEIKEKKSEEASSEETTTEEASSEEASSEEVSSEAASSEEVSSEAASSEEVSSEAVSSEEVSSEAASSEEASSEAVSSSEEASSEEASGETPTPTPSPKPTPSPAPTATATIRPPVRPTVIVINPVPTQRPTVRPTTGTWPPNNATQRPTTRPTARPTSALADAFGRVSPGRDSTLSLADDLVPLAGMIRWLTWFEEKSAGWIVSGDAVLYVSEENGVLSALQAIDISPYLDPPRNWFSETLIVVPSEDGRVMMIAVWDELQQKTTQAILLLDTATMEFVRITGTKGVERFDLSLSGRYAAYIQNDTLHVVDVTEAKIFSNMIAVETVEGVKQETDGILLNCLSFGLADTLLIYVDEANASHTGTWLDFVEGVYYQAPADRTYPLAQPTNEYVELYVIQGAGGAELRLTEANADQAKLEERYLLTHNPAKKDFYQWLRRQPREKKTYSSE